MLSRDICSGVQVKVSGSVSRSHGMVIGTRELSSLVDLVENNDLMLDLEESVLG